MIRRRPRLLQGGMLDCGRCRRAFSSLTFAFTASWRACARLEHSHRGVRRVPRLWICNVHFPRRLTLAAGAFLPGTVGDARQSGLSHAIRLQGMSGNWPHSRQSARENQSWRVPKEGSRFKHRFHPPHFAHGCTPIWPAWRCRTAAFDVCTQRFQLSSVMSTHSARMTVNISPADALRTCWWRGHSSVHRDASRHISMSAYPA